MLKEDSISVPGWYIFYKKCVTFLRTSLTLQLFFLFTVAIFSMFLYRFLENGLMVVSWNTIFTLFFFSLAITTQLDAYSRYQNYKQVKDLIHKNGFRGMIIKPFAGSRCQRDAVREMANQLKIKKLVRQYFYHLGYRWYHIIPTTLFRKPLLIFTRGYWITIFFVPRYRSKYFLW